MRYPLLLLLAFALTMPRLSAQMTTPGKAYLIVLGIAQDAGYPQIECHNECCEAAVNEPSLRRMVACLGLVDKVDKKKFIIDATPDLAWQMRKLEQHTGEFAGILLTHAHIGHYAGLMFLGREAMGASGVPVFAMPRMADYLRKNGPWSQLVEFNNIDIRPLEADSTIRLTDAITATPFLVPHRDEFSETVGYRIQGPKKTALFIPDIDKWQKWDRDIGKAIATVDYAFLDGTFYADGELPGRDMSEIPHPFIEESMKRFDDLTTQEKKKIWFIHFNHTNPAMREDSEAQRAIREKGFNIANEGLVLEL